MLGKNAIKEVVLLGTTLTCLCGVAFAQEAAAGASTAQDNATSTADANADNTRRNVRDRDSNTSTPFDQGSSESDRETTRKIRKEVVGTENFSTKAKNVKIVTNNGKVVLRGPVDTAVEKQQINDIAQKIAGSSNVEDQLEVKTAN